MTSAKSDCTRSEQSLDADSEREAAKTILGAEPTAITMSALAVFAAVALIVIGMLVALTKNAQTWIETGDRILVLVGFLLTGSALGFALLIFQMQRQEGRAQERRLTAFTAEMEQRMHGRFDDLEASQAKQVKPDIQTILQHEAASPATNTVEEDPYGDLRTLPSMSPEEMEQIGVTPEQAREFKVHSPLQIPIRVLGDLHVGWARMDERGDLQKVTRWEAGEAVAYRRRKAGNHAWYIRLTDRDKPENSYFWRVSRGGQGKTEPTVEQLSP